MLPYERTTYDLDISKGGEGGENRYIIFFFDVESPTPYCVCALCHRRGDTKRTRGARVEEKKQTTTGRRGQRGRR